MPPDLRALIANPPAEFRNMPFFVWNGELTPQRITEVIEQFHANGAGGVFIHPRPGLITPYLSERWFEMFGHALRECRRLGMICNIYDENSFPAGFAGGHVMARIPYAAARVARLRTHSGEAAPHGQVLAAYRVEHDAFPRLDPREDWRARAREHDVATLELHEDEPDPWHAWFPYVDLLRPQVTREFLRCTHEAYHERFASEFGGVIRAAFADEPKLHGGRHSVPLSRFLLAEFQRDHGYDLLDRAVDLFRNTPSAAATRFDYCATLQRLFIDSYVRPMSEWCAAHRVDFTGHFMEHEWPRPWSHPSAMHAQSFMQMPGIDLLGFQFDHAAPQQSDLLLMTCRELASVAHQLGRTRTLAELHGGGGNQITFEQIRRLGDWGMVHGVNLVNEHLSFQSIAGTRRCDWPQTFSDHSPWWSDYRPIAEHQARLSVLLAHGRRVSRTLVLHATTTGWVLATPEQGGMPTPRGLFAPESPLASFTSDHCHFVQELCDRQIDFCLGDELILREHGRVEDGKLRVGEAAYDLLVIPPTVANLCRSTLRLIGQWLEAGGHVLSGTTLPSMIDGRPDGAARDLASAHRRQWRMFDYVSALLDAIGQSVPPLLVDVDGDPLGRGIGHQPRRYDDGSQLHLLVNSSDRQVTRRLRRPGAPLARVDTASGRIIEVPSQGETFELDLPPLACVALVCGPLARSAEPAPTPRRWSAPRRVEAFDAIAPIGDNALALIFCDLETRGRRIEGLYVFDANRANFHLQGLERAVWDAAIQFRDNYSDFAFDESSAFAVEYGVEVERAAGVRIALAVERPHLYSVAVNGQKVDVAAGRRWLDEAIRSADITPLLRDGMNRIRLEAARFDVLAEIAPAYLVGDFAATPGASGFRVGPPTPLRTGDWTGQGLAMFSGAVRCAARLRLDAPARALRVAVPRWHGAVLRVLVDGRRLGLIGWPPNTLDAEVDLDAGEHELAIEVVSTAKNLLGPQVWHSWNVRRLAGPFAWHDLRIGPQPGAEYDLVPFGLDGPIEWSVEPR